MMKWLNENKFYFLFIALTFIFYQSSIDTIELKHTAHNRKGFAGGALTAAAWLIGKKGIYTMDDVLGFNQ